MANERNTTLTRTLGLDIVLCAHVDVEFAVIRNPYGHFNRLAADVAVLDVALVATGNIDDERDVFAAVGTGDHFGGQHAAFLAVGGLGWGPADASDVSACMDVVQARVHAPVECVVLEKFPPDVCAGQAVFIED